MHDRELLTCLKDDSIVSIFDTGGRMIYSNKHFAKLLEIPKNGAEVVAMPLLKSLIDSRALFCKIWRLLQAGDEWKGMLCHKGKNNRTYWLESAITPIKNEYGNVVKYLSISKDITKYYGKESCNATSYSKEKRRIENITKDELFITKNGKIFNTAPNNINDTDTAILGSNIYDYVSSESRDFLKKQIEKVFSEGKIGAYQSVGLSSKVNQNFFITKIRPVLNLQNEVIYARLKSKKHKNTIKINQELKAIETKYSNIFQSINVGIIVVANGNGTIIEWNKGAEKAFGYTDSEIIGKHLSKIISEKQVDNGLQELLKAKDKLDNNIDCESIEMIGLKKTDEEFPVEFTMSHWQNGKEKFYCAVMFDISKRKKLEDKLKKTTKDLELFLYRSAHDLKAPLTSAEGLLLLLKDENIDDKALEIVHMLDETIEKGQLLLEDLALASIISEKRREITPIKFELKFNNALKVIKNLDNFDAIDFQFDIVQETDFYFNRELMDFIFQNLMRNVVCFAKPKTELHRSTAHIRVNVTEKELRIVVSDNGFGIEKDNIDKVFDLYFSVCKKSCSATGLGLYIVKRIVEEFNGDVTVESELNKGTSFEVILPNLKEEN